MGNPDIWSGICHYCCICLFLFGVLTCFWLFCVRRAISSCVSLKSSVICHTSLPQYVKVAQFVFCFGSSHVLCFCNCDGTFSVRFALYSFLYNMSFIVCDSICFASVVIGYVCSRVNRKLILESWCSWEWHELLGITMSVCVGFLYVENANLSVSSVYCDV
jgi:hypothetical protein